MANSTIYFGESCVFSLDLYGMKDELTAEMHYEFFADFVPHDLFMVFAASGAIARGASKKEACQKYGITEEFYDQNLEKADEAMDSA